VDGRHSNSAFKNRLWKHATSAYSMQAERITGVAMNPISSHPLIQL
jgi:hypothetical protein